MAQYTLAAFLSGIFGGSLTYVALDKLFKEVESAGLVMSAVQKRLLAYVLSFLLSFGALGLSYWLGYSPITPDTVFVAAGSAYMASQAWHMRNLPPPT